MVYALQQISTLFIGKQVCILCGPHEFLYFIKKPQVSD